jgi:hypothetical protein
VDELRKRIAEEAEQTHRDNWRRLAACLGKEIQTGPASRPC